jgi:hypothetical protein
MVYGGAPDGSTPEGKPGGSVTKAKSKAKSKCTSTKSLHAVRAEVQVMNLATEVGFLAASMLNLPVADELSEIEEILAVLAALRRSVRQCEQDYLSRRAAALKWRKENPDIQRLG